MSTDEHTPTTDEVREAVTEFFGWHVSAQEAEARFNRWLRQRDDIIERVRNVAEWLDSEAVDALHDIQQRAEQGAADPKDVQRSAAAHVKENIADELTAILEGRERDV